MDLLIGLVILLFSAIIHEVAHGWVAEKLGDPTARVMGRLTLDPRVHIDPVMSLLLPFLLIIGGSPIVFGAAKPVPVDPFNLREGRKDLALVALSGPLSNILIAIIAAIIYKVLLITNASDVLTYIVTLIAQYNVMLAIFNLIPIPPLDGSKVFSIILPEREAVSYLALGNFGMILIYFLLLFPIGGFSLGNGMYHLLQQALHILGF